LGKITKGSNTYDGAYDDAMERIQHQLPDQEDLAMQALAWITHAKAPLTTGELRHALAIESGQTELDEENLSEIEDIVSACVGLVTIDVKSDVIRLVHYTTQDYFERNRSRWFSTAEEDITGHCMTYLSFTTFDSGPCKDDGGFEERLEVYRLYTYSAKHWASHASKVNPTGGEPIAFTMSNAQVQAASQAMLVQKKSFVQSYSQKFDVLPTRLHFAAFFGLSSLVRRFLPRQEHQAGTKRLAGLTLEHVDEVDSRDVLGMTPLNLAASKGFTDVVVLLLDHGANVDTAANDAWTPLCGAIYKGNQEMVDLLLRAGACVNPKIPTIWSPLCLAVRGGHEDMVGQLLESGAYREATDSEVSSLLCIAASKGVTKVVRQLLQQGANFERSARPDKRTPLSWAAANGHDNVATTLILYGASLHVKDKLGYRPMGLAAFHGHQGMVARFLRHGVNVDQRNRAGSTALHLAATRGHIGVVKLLLDQGANIDFQDKEGYTALHRAAKADSNPAVMLLLLKRASVEVQDAAGRTPLSWAAGNGCKHVIKLLLIRRAAVGVKDATGRTALSWAAGNGRDNVIKLLLEHGVDANEADQNGQTPLGWAVAHGHADAAALLLLHNGSTSVDMRDSKGRTPLLWAAWKDHADIADLLLDHGAELEACDSHGRTPLSWAVGAVAAVTLLRLLARGADVESCDERGQTPLMWAVKGGKDGLAGTIRRQMASGDISNPPLTAEVETTSRLDGGNSAATSLQPPMPASRHHRSDTPHERPGPRNRSFVVIHADRRTFTPVVHNYTDIARCLLDKGAALEARDHAGQTALSIAAANNNNTAVELLLSRGARLDTRDTKGHSPLAYATAAGHEAMVRLLLDRGARTEVE
jgi:ankyrin repeat protein